MVVHETRSSFIDTEGSWGEVEFTSYGGCARTQTSQAIGLFGKKVQRTLVPIIYSILVITLGLRKPDIFKLWDYIQISFFSWTLDNSKKSSLRILRTPTDDVVVSRWYVVSHHPYLEHSFMNSYMLPY